MKFLQQQIIIRIKEITDKMLINLQHEMTYRNKVISMSPSLPAKLL